MESASCFNSSSSSNHPSSDSFKFLPRVAMLARYMLSSCARLGCLSICLSVCLCVCASVYLCICYTPVLCKNGKHRITQTTPHDSARTLVFDFYIFVVGEHRDFKFGMQIDHNPRRRSINFPWKGRGHITWPILNISGTAKLETSNFLYWLAMWSIIFWIDELCLKWAWTLSHDLF